MKAQTQIISKHSSGLAYIGKPEQKNTTNKMHEKVITKNSGAQLRVVKRMHSDKDKITISATSPKLMLHNNINIHHTHCLLCLCLSLLFILWGSIPTSL